mmetsp:Transcript_20052/g.34511  ORF Transcript_20052/g.34511 Transcript_20052/m.34511 type:complete len:1094 (+) Transcript_20052:147-3428(+)
MESPKNPWELSIDELLAAYGHDEHTNNGSPSSTITHKLSNGVYLSTEPFNGLTTEQVEKQRRKYGLNALEKEQETSIWELILDQFKDQLVLILMFAAAVSFILAMTSPSEDRIADLFEPLVIVLILIANAVVGVMQERNAEAAIEALKSHQPEYARVIRNFGQKNQISADQLVPGDVIEVATGDKIPADARILEIHSSVLQVDQSIATGESQAVSKRVEPVKGSHLVLQDKICMLFGGTTISRGKCLAIVTATGMNSEIGKIHKAISQEDNAVSPLKRKLDEFGEFLSKVILVICIGVWLVNMKNFTEHGTWVQGALYYFKIAIALAVAAIPEGLPAVVTTCLALGTRRMSVRKAIVRHLPAVEALGCTTIICSDKTGTLTTNNMMVLKVAYLNENSDIIEWDVDGTALEPTGKFCLDMKSQPHLARHPLANTRITYPGCESKLDPHSRYILNETALVATLCNESSIVYDASKQSYEKLGEGTEAALTVLAEKIGVNDDSFAQTVSTMTPSESCHAVRSYYSSHWQKLAILDFSRDRKSMSVLVGSHSMGARSRSKGHQDAGANAESHERKLLVKGAPESIIRRCSSVCLGSSSADSSLLSSPSSSSSSSTKHVALDSKTKTKFLQVIETWSSKQALRCLALAVRSGSNAPTLESLDLTDPTKFAEYESQLTLLAIVGMIDPPREEVKGAIQVCKQAKIRVVVITGDNKLTASAVCRRIGLFEGGDDESLDGKVYTGQDLDGMTRAEKRLAVQTANLFARVEPSHKLELVDLLQESGKEVVAMTGDGVNDAPALKRADIGIAMGSGTAVAREVSSIVLADDNFATIVAAVEEGRAIYMNMKQFIRYLISSNIGEVWCIFLTALFGMPEALVPVQLLWVNLVTDGLPATALSFNPAEDDLMTHYPRGMNDPVVDAWLFFRYVVIGTYVGIATVGGFAWWYLYYEHGPRMTWNELVSFHQCVDDLAIQSQRGWKCSVFHESAHASTVALSILVTIEMFNALNNVSDTKSMFQLSPLRNRYLVAAITLSFALHAVILYVPFFNRIFQTAPLSLVEWSAVIWISLPVMAIDEGLKWMTRVKVAREERGRLLHDKKEL